VIEVALVSASPRHAGAAALARAFVLAARLTHSRSHALGLYPAQWAALRYFKSASGEHRTAVRLAHYQGLAFGPVARTVRTLISRGYLRKAGSAGRGRGKLIELTAKGEDILTKDPLIPLARSLRGLESAAQNVLAEALERILRALAATTSAGEEH
jgi:DNA-binding MarR family transcriptional regulator